MTSKDRPDYPEDELDVDQTMLEEDIQEGSQDEQVLVERTSIIPQVDRRKVVRPAPNYQVPSTPPPPPPAPGASWTKETIKINEIPDQSEPGDQTKVWYKSWQTWVLLIVGIIAAIALTWALTTKSDDTKTSQIESNDADVVATLQTQSIQLQDQVDALQKNEADIKEQLSEAQKQLNAKTSELAASQQAQADLSNVNDSLNSQIDTANDARAKAEADLAQSKADLATVTTQRDAWKKVGEEMATVIKNAGLAVPTLPND